MSGKGLRELERESAEWNSENRGKGFYFHECPGWTDEHNRRIEIARLSARLSDCPFRSESRRTDYAYNGEEL